MLLAVFLAHPQALQTCCFPAHIQALQSAAALGVADSLAGGPLPVADLAQAVGAKVDSLRRVLRLLVALGIFEETSPGGECLTCKQRA